MKYGKLILRLGTLSVLLLIGWVLFSGWPHPEPDRLPPHVDAIIVLGGGATERPRQAWKLFSEGRADRIIVTGDGDIIVNDLIKRGLPKSSLIHEKKATSTLENAKETHAILNDLKVRTAIIVTTWSHSQRAKRTFEKIAPHVKFYSSFEPAPETLNHWEIASKRRERIAALYFLFCKGIWCF
jgi:uncharacterized SAM-binding protein YcdF (DUF218 family)